MGDRAPSILIAGHFGFGNLGDEAILAAMIAHLREAAPAAKLCVVSGEPDATRALHGVQAVDWRDWEQIISRATASDLLLLGGGGLFHDYWGFDPDTLLTGEHAGLSFFGALPLLGALLEKPVMLYAVGVGPLHSALGRAYTRTVFELASRATVRDAVSLEQLRAIGAPTQAVQLTADPVFDLADQPAAAALPDGAEHPRVGVALREWSIDVSAEYWERHVAAALDAFLDRYGGAVVFIPFQSGQGAVPDDRRVAERVRGRMRNAGRAHVAEQERDPRRRARQLAGCDLVLAQRLHAAVLALSGYVPVVALAYDPKVRCAMERAGCASWALDLGGLTAERLLQRLGAAYEQRAALSAKLEGVRPALVAAARENARIALGLLESPPAPAELTPRLYDLLRKTVLAHTRRLARLEQEASDWKRAATDLRDSLRVQARERDEQIGRIQSALQAEVEKRDRELQAMQAALDVEISKRERVIGDLKDALQEQARERDRVVGELRAAAAREVAERERVIAELKATAAAEMAASRAAMEREQALRQAREAELYAIHTARYWRALSVYWRARHRIAAAYTGLRAVLRRLLPYSFRRAVVRRGRRAGLLPPAPASASAARKFSAAEPEPALPQSRYDVIRFPVIDWEFRFQRPQQFTTQFAAQGHRCFYFRTTCHQEGDDVRQWPISDNVHNVQLPGPPDLNIYAETIAPEMLDGFLAALERWRSQARISAAVCFVDLPFWAPLARAARQRWGWKVVYDCMDEHAGFSTNSPAMLEQERGLLANSDLVLATSERLYQKCAAQAETARVLSLPNAVDFEHFHDPPRNNPLAHLARPVIGFYGAISDWFDVEMVRWAALERPHWQFVLIGDTFGADVGRLQRLANVHLLGEVPYEELPAYLHSFDVACIPFRFTRLTRAINPVKFYEYLSAGKPVVSVVLPELEAHEQHFYPVHHREDFVLQLEAALREDSAAAARARVEFARANTWVRRFATLEPAVRALFGRAVIVVVTYNNPEYLRLCLESIWARTVYPNYEVIVVDNGSNAEIGRFLREAARRKPRLTVLRNDGERSFAAANNLGVAHAGTCDYIVLLNDDTVVTRGWLTGLVRHLERQPEIGLVGPVTNCAANEAQIPVTYERLADMETFAERYTCTHAGETFDIKILAMYCIAMRRSLIDEIGPLDERFGVGMFEDDDYSLRVRRAGRRVACAEDVFVHHWGRASFRQLPQVEYDRIFDENRRKFEGKWGRKWHPHRARPGLN